MNKKLDIELDIPADDLECWERYPKHRWVYEKSRLFDSQGLKWGILKNENYCHAIANIQIDSIIPTAINSGIIYTKEDFSSTERFNVYIQKGEIKLIRNCDSNEKNGHIELRITAFVALHFTKFTGVIQCWCSNGNIVRISLMPSKGNLDNPESLKLLKKIYRKTDITLIGLSDRAFNDSLAS